MVLLCFAEHGGHGNGIVMLQEQIIQALFACAELQRGRATRGSSGRRRLG